MNNHSNMLIYLKGISSAHLEHVDFMYNGEVFITQEEFKPFLEIAQELKVKGLQGDLQGIFKSGPEDAVYSENELENRNEDIIDPDKIVDKTDVDLVEIDEGTPRLNTNNELDYQIQQIIEKNDGLWICKVCDKTATTKQRINLHAEIHIDGVTHVCHICSKTVSTRHNLQVHISNNHSKLVSCDICGKSGMKRAAYSMHKRTHHKTISL